MEVNPICLRALLFILRLPEMEVLFIGKIKTK